MSVTPPADLAGVLPVVISGGRPSMSQRYTAKLLGPLSGVTADPVWLVREDKAVKYQRDDHELVTFGVDEAEAYASTHWFSPDPFVPGGFTGAFCEREWACRLAAERGCWAVLQLDDNLLRLAAYTGYAIAQRAVAARGGLAFYADVLAAVTLGSNSRMTGAKMASVNPASESGVFARPGFPYSLFLERVDLPDREPWFGPFEDDILHAYAYGSRADDATAALVYPITYSKEHTNSSKSGMRNAYKAQQRAAGLTMVAPEMARATVKAAHSNGRGEPRIFHWMAPGSIRTPLIVRDEALFDGARDACSQLRRELNVMFQADATMRVQKRARRAQARLSLAEHLGGRA